ncbi:MAG: type II toxin-antitoxin system VapC family toxin [Acidimicrobiia bacterium]
MIVVDTGVAYAAADRDDPDHPASAQLLAAHPGQLRIPTPVIVETSWLIERRLGPAAEAGFLRSVRAGEVTRVDLTDDDWDRAVELVESYADLGLGLVDASVVTVAERLGIDTIATLNHRDFRVVRPRHVDAFELIP